MPDEKILDKIRALLAKTEENGCTAEEAESAFAMAQRLMAKHAVDEAVLAASGHDVKREPIIKHHVHMRDRDEIKRQKIAIIGAIAKANDCRIVDATETWDQVWIVGHESDAFFVEILSSAVLMQYATERTRGWKAYQAYWSPAKPPMSRFKWLQSFAWGYAERIAARIAAEAQAATSEAMEGVSKGLVLVDRKSLVQEWMDENLATRQTKARPVRINPAVAGRGAAAANRANLSGGRNNVAGGGSKAIG